MVIPQDKSDISIQEFHSFLPFLISTNENGSILSMGASLVKSIGGSYVGNHIEDVFLFQRPSNWSSLPDENLGKFIVFLQEKNTGLAFKAQALRHSNGNVYFALNPLITANSQIRDFNLAIGDFPVFDTIAEYLFLRQTNSNGLREATILNDTLIEKNKALEKARIELSETNAKLESKVEERTRQLETQMQSLEISKKEIERKSQELQSTLEKLKRAQFEIVNKEKMSMLGQLVSGIAHEINTPLGSIKGAAFNLNQTIATILESAASIVGKTHLSAIQELYIQGKRKDLLPNEIFDRTKLLAKELEIQFPAIENPKVLASKLLNSGLDDLHHPFVEYVTQLENYHPVLDLTSELNLLYQGLTTIEIAAERGSKVVNALKSYVHTDIHAQKTTFNLKAQVDSVILLFLNATRRGISIVNSIPEHIKFTGKADQLTQVWTNLVSNAIHAIDGNGHITFQCRCETSRLIIDVTNDGPAIPENQLQTIFEPFYTTKERGIGTGLGLNIIEKIIEHHKGEIICTSSDENTTFSIILPINPDS